MKIADNSEQGDTDVLPRTLSIFFSFLGNLLWVGNSTLIYVTETKRNLFSNTLAQSTPPPLYDRLRGF